MSSVVFGVFDGFGAKHVPSLQISFEIVIDVIPAQEQVEIHAPPVLRLGEMSGRVPWLEISAFAGSGHPLSSLDVGHVQGLVLVELGGTRDEEHTQHCTGITTLFLERTRDSWYSGETN
jgi:hypothetical protein